MSELYKKMATNAWTFYENEIDRTASRAFDEVVKPFLIARGFSFVAGMGMCVISDANGDVVDWENWDKSADAKEREVFAVLELDLDGYNQTLGTLMPEHKPKQAGS